MESNYSSDNIPEIALSWVSLGEPVVLATVVETWGSAPRRVGAQMAISLMERCRVQYRADVSKTQLCPKQKRQSTQKRLDYLNMV